MNTKTLSIKARLTNKLRTLFYKKRIESFSDVDKIKIFDEIFTDMFSIHWELVAYKGKRKDRAELLKKRLASPPTKTMKKKLGLVQKNPKINLDN